MAILSSDLDILSYVTKAFADSRLTADQSTKTKKKLSRDAYKRIGKILGEHLDCFSTEMSSREAELLSRLTNEEAAVMFVVYLCDIVSKSKKQRAPDDAYAPSAWAVLSRENVALRDKLAAAENERDELRLLHTESNREAQSFKLAFHALMRDRESMRSGRVEKRGDLRVFFGGAQASFQLHSDEANMEKELWVDEPPQDENSGDESDRSN